VSKLEIDDIQPQASLLWIILGLRIVLFAIELGTAIWTHSVSLLAGAGHLFADLLTLGLTLLAAWVVQRQPVARTAPTQQRLKAWIGLINGIALGAIALLIAQEAMNHLQNVGSMASLPMLLVAGLSLIVNGLAVYLLYRHRHRERSKFTLLAWLVLKKKQRFIGGLVLTRLSRNVCMRAQIFWC
jgi:cobalt-zinc-cadmium efflux system protein